MVDRENARIVTFDLSGEHRSTWGGASPEEGGLGDPRGVAVDSLGNIHVSDFSANHISVFTPEGQFLRTWGKAGAGRGEFANPAGLCGDNNGAMYVVDLRNHRVQQFQVAG